MRNPPPTATRAQGWKGRGDEARLIGHKPAVVRHRTRKDARPAKPIPYDLKGSLSGIPNS